MGCESSNVSSLDQKINNIKDIQKELDPNHENEEQEENDEQEENEEQENGENIKEKKHKKNNKSQELEGSGNTAITKNSTKKLSNAHQLTNEEEGEVLSKKELKKLKQISKNYSQDDPDHGVFVDTELIKSSQLDFSEMDMARMILTAQAKYRQKEKYYEIGTKKEINLDKNQIKRAAQIIWERVKSYKAKLEDEFDREKPINDPLLKDYLIKVGFKELTEQLLNKTCFKDRGVDKSELSDALKYGGKKGNIYKVMVIEIL